MSYYLVKQNIMVIEKKYKLLGSKYLGPNVLEL